MYYHKSSIKEARIALDSFKEEIAKEMGLENFTYAGYVGGHMVRRMIEMAENSLIDNQEIKNK